MTAAAGLGAERVLAPLDVVRSAVLRRFGRPLRFLLVDREARVGVYAFLSVGAALLLTATVPLWLLAIGPLVLGAPHLLCDARYLVARRGLHRRPTFWVFVVLPLTITWLYPSLLVGLVAVAGAALVARTSFLSRVGLLVACALLAVPLLRAPMLAGIWFAHAHNVIAVLFFCAWSSRRARFHVPALLLMLAGAAVIFAGVLDPLVLHGIALDPPGPGLDLHTLGYGLSPSSAPLAALHWILFFAFAQSVHYAVWIRLVPEEDRPRVGIRSFRSSYRALCADVGWPLIACVCLLAVGLLAWGAVAAFAARDGYLRLAFFHGPLEVAVAAVLLLEGRIPIERRAPARARA